MEDSGEQLQSEEEELNIVARNIQEDVAIISVLNSKILHLRASIHDREVSANFQPEVAKTEIKFQEELSKALIHRKLAKTCLQSAALPALLREENEYSQTLITVLKQYSDLLQQLRNIHSKDIKLEIMKKKIEYVDKLNDFKNMLEEQKEQQKLSQQHKESTRLKEKISMKLEKINVMRMLMLNIICSSHIDYEAAPQYSQQAGRLLEPLTFKSIKVMDITEEQQ